MLGGWRSSLRDLLSVSAGANAGFGPGSCLHRRLLVHGGDLVWQPGPHGRPRSRGSGCCAEHEDLADDQGRSPARRGESLHERADTEMPVSPHSHDRAQEGHPHEAATGELFRHCDAGVCRRPAPPSPPGQKYPSTSLAMAFSSERHPLIVMVGATKLCCRHMDAKCLAMRSGSGSTPVKRRKAAAA